MYDDYQGLIFDMDGTLLDTERPHIKAWQQVLAKYDMEYDYNFMKQFNGAPTYNFARIIIEKHNRDIDPAIIVEEKVKIVESIILDEVEMLPLFDVVKQYYGKKPMAIGTGSRRRLAEQLLNHLGVRHYFDAIVGADDVQTHKPSPETFLLCANLIQVEPQKCVVFEDADFGIQAAKAANMHFVDVRSL